MKLQVVVLPVGMAQLCPFHLQVLPYQPSPAVSYNFTVQESPWVKVMGPSIWAYESCVWTSGSSEPDAIACRVVSSADVVLELHFDSWDKVSSGNTDVSLIGPALPVSPLSFIDNFVDFLGVIQLAASDFDSVECGIDTLVLVIHCGHVRVCRAHHPWLPVTP